MCSFGPSDPLRLPFGDKTRVSIQAGDEAALLRALLATAASWLEAGGASIGTHKNIGMATCVVHRSPEAGALMAAGIDLLNVLELSPQGRKALADFGRQPLLQQTKGE